MTMTFTPGPWRIRARAGSSCWVLPVEDDEPPVAQLYDVNPEIDGNARLIAAAPDLLDACIGYLEAQTVEEADDYHAAMKRAVAKAIGEASR